MLDSCALDGAEMGGAHWPKAVLRHARAAGLVPGKQPGEAPGVRDDAKGWRFYP